MRFLLCLIEEWKEFKPFINWTKKKTSFGSLHLIRNIRSACVHTTVRNRLYASADSTSIGSLFSFSILFLLGSITSQIFTHSIIDCGPYNFCINRLFYSCPPFMPSFEFERGQQHMCDADTSVCVCKWLGFFVSYRLYYDFFPCIIIYLVRNQMSVIMNVGQLIRKLCWCVYVFNNKNAEPHLRKH